MKILAAAQDDAIVSELDSALAGSDSDQHGELTLLLCTPTLEQPYALAPIMDAAVEAWQRNVLIAICVDGTEPPLGFRDAPRVTWMRDSDSPDRLRDLLARTSTAKQERAFSQQDQAPRSIKLQRAFGPHEIENAPRIEPPPARGNTLGLVAGAGFASMLAVVLSLLLFFPSSGDFPRPGVSIGEVLNNPGQVERHHRRAARLPQPSPNSPPAGLLERAAEQGDAQAAYNLGLLYAHGEGVARDETKAISLITTAAKNNFPIAKYRLGTIYEQGIVLPKDPDQAQQWYASAAADGNQNAMHNLGALLAKDPDQSTEAARWFRAAAETGLTDSQYNIGLLYERGTGVKRDLTEAAKWYAIASINGDIEAGDRFRAVTAQLDADQTSRAVEAAAAFQPKAIDPAANEAPSADEPSESTDLVDRIHIARELERSIPTRDSARRAWLHTAITEAISSIDKASARRSLEAAIADAEKAYPDLLSRRRDARIPNSSPRASLPSDVNGGATPAPEATTIDVDPANADAVPEAVPQSTGDSLDWRLLMALAAAALAIALLTYAAVTRSPTALWTALFPRTRAALGIRQPAQNFEQDTMLPAVFASYSREDALRVDRVVAELENDGIGVWVDRQRIAGGAPWPAQIVRAIRDSQVLAVFCSQHAFSSDHVFREIHLAIQYKKVLVPIMLEPVPMPDLFLYYLSPFQAVPVTQSTSGVKGALDTALLMRDGTHDEHRRRTS
jgi:TIR domain/Sel1 repeat